VRACIRELKFMRVHKMYMTSERELKVQLRPQEPTQFWMMSLKSEEIFRTFLWKRMNSFIMFILFSDNSMMRICIVSLFTTITRQLDLSVSMQHGNMRAERAFCGFFIIWVENLNFACINFLSMFVECERKEL
jgi:hypothetical protein